MAISRDRGDDAAEGILVGGQIRDLRKAKGLTIAELADRIDRSIGFVSQIERNLSELAGSSIPARPCRPTSAAISCAAKTGGGSACRGSAWLKSFYRPAWAARPNWY
jgi:hypothetical protein